MLALRLVIVVALIVQALWAQAGLLPAGPCSRSAKTTPVRVQADAPAKKGCCRRKMDAGERVGGCRSQRHAAPLSDEAKAKQPPGCNPASCRRCPAPRTPRPVDRIPSSPKQAAPPPAVEATTAVVMIPPRAALRASAPAIPAVTNNDRRASLCIWRN